ncbi:MAG: tRNA (N6-isopentenyl adenosine(37)-C2)-methylthiotransferase MiaB [Oscillospiraceae bacterium]|jgi:tRNA-2-methylthio-N6-dimethylallyladenosine synthase|nr:tRNA (N6-isopentenyl adenosine(37)-C2)-methylthiotransferase MiaB [Oscillospiraceae bacterium]
MKAYIKIYGCQQNEADGESLRGMLKGLGFGFVNSAHEADFIIFNTCAVRHTAENKVLGHLGELKKIKDLNPKLVIALCGCMTEQDSIKERIFKHYSFIDIVLGTNFLKELDEILNKKFSLSSNNPQKKNDEFLIRQNKFKAWVPIISGCNNFCSYCIVPYVRGREKSKDSNEILNEIKGLISKNYKDITLLGQNVNSYGKDLSNKKMSFASLLREINKVGGDYILRFMTSHPKDFTDELIDVLSETQNFCRHIHLPFQSGSNRILKMMNRGYTRESYLEIVRKIRGKLPETILTSDVIVGFPGETEKDFKDTLSLISEVGFISLFSFIYSPREGTAASKFPDFVERQEKKRRMERLLKLQREISRKILDEMVGLSFCALVESKKGNEILARTTQNLIVEIKNCEYLQGKLLRVRIMSHEHGILKGEVINVIEREEILKKAKDLNLIIQQSNEFLKFIQSKSELEKDLKYKAYREEFDSKKNQLNEEMANEHCDSKKVSSLSEDLRIIFGKMQKSESMANFENSRRDFESLISEVTSMVSSCLIDDFTRSGCGGSCVSCTGCG